MRPRRLHRVLIRESLYRTGECEACGRSGGVTRWTPEHYDRRFPESAQGVPFGDFCRGCIDRIEDVLFAQPNGPWWSTP